MRGLFKDGLNSWAHFAVGFAAVEFQSPVLMLGFLFYQLMNIDDNTQVDCAEFALGAMAASVTIRDHQ